MVLTVLPTTRLERPPKVNTKKPPEKAALKDVLSFCFALYKIVYEFYYELYPFIGIGQYFLKGQFLLCHITFYLRVVYRTNLAILFVYSDYLTQYLDSRAGELVRLPGCVRRGGAVERKWGVRLAVRPTGATHDM